MLFIPGTLGLALSNYLHSKKMIRSLKYMQPYLDPSERQEANTPEDSKVKFDNIKTCTTSDIGVIDHILDGQIYALYLLIIPQKDQSNITWAILKFGNLCGFNGSVHSNVKLFKL